MPVTAETIEKLLAQIDELLAEVSSLTEELKKANEQHRADEAKIEALTKKVVELSKKKVKKDSHNSSKPPSSDGYAKPKPQSLREISGKNVGGQKGHAGNGMKVTREPDVIKQCRPSQCEGCPNMERCKYTCTGKRYVYDAEVTVQLVEYETLAVNCPLEGQKRIEGKFPAEAAAPKQYGSNLRAFVGALSTVGYVSVDRIRQFLNGFGIPISSGSIQNMIDDLSLKAEATDHFIREKVASFEALHCDETGIRINGKLNWLHCICTPLWSYFVVHEKRGSVAMDEIGIIPSLDGCTLIHDFWSSYLKYANVNHAFCNAHIERELVYAYETTHQQWAEQLKELLSEMCKRRNELFALGFTSFPAAELSEYLARYDKYIEEGLSANPLQERAEGKRGRLKKGKTRCLLERLEEYKDNILRFATDWSIPFTNNEAERSIRFTKVKTKVSGCFRTKDGADGFASTMSYISTAKKHGVFAFEALLSLIKGESLQLLETWA